MDREPKVDSVGRSWGSGRRKRARAVVNVKAGSGKVLVNGKPVLDYFLMPVQRHTILMPLSITNYTCLLDVYIRVHGGGLTGQA